MAITQLIPTFAGGEFSPQLQSRADLQKYFTGLKTAKNFIVHPYGGASNRPGTKYVAKAKYGNRKSRLITFEYSTDQSYAIEFGHLYCRFFRNGGQVLSGGVTYEIVSPYTEDDIFDLKFTQSNDVLYLVHPNFAPRSLSRFGDTNWSFAILDIKNGPFMSKNINESHTMLVMPSGPDYTMTSNLPFFNQFQVGGLFEISYNVQSMNVSSPIVNGSGTSNTIYSNGTWRMVTGSAAAWGGELSLEQSFDLVNWRVIRSFTSAVSTNGIVDSLCALRVRSSSAVNLSYNLSSDPFTHSASVKVLSYNSNVSVNVEISGMENYPGNWLNPAAVTEAKPTNMWAEGSFSDYRGYPSCVSFYQDRLAFAATPLEQETTWYSKTGIYTDFGRSVPLVDSDGISLNLPARSQNPIKNLLPLQKILTLTSANEWSVGPGSSGVFTPTSIEQKVQGYRGSSAINPLVVGNRVIYVQSRNSILRDIAFSFADDAFVGDNLTIFSSHLFKGYQIKEMAYQQEPDSLCWVVRSDGKLLSMTYMKEQEVLAWTRHETDGEFESVCVLSAGNYNQPWFVVKRGSDRFIEYMVNRDDNPDTTNQFFVDCGIIYEGAPAQTLTGFDHLEGKTVVALADGFVIKNLLVNSGEVTLPQAASRVIIGLPYESVLETLDVESSANVGALQANQIKIVQVIVTFLNTRGGYIGTDEDLLEEIVNRMDEPLDTPIDLFSGKILGIMDGVFDFGGRIVIKQTDPLPMTVLSLLPKVAVGN